MHNESLRELLDKHMKDWRVTDEPERMEVHGWLKAMSVEVTLRGQRDAVVASLEALIHTLVSTDRLHR